VPDRLRSGFPGHLRNLGPHPRLGGLEPGRALGYVPQDAERHAATVEARPATESDDQEAAHLGGSFTAKAVYRTALDRD
jgi:hypothetical protein